MTLSKIEDVAKEVTKNIINSPNNFIQPELMPSRIDNKIGRLYHIEDNDGNIVDPIYSSTTIIEEVLAKGIGFNKWLGNSVSYESAMEYANHRATIGTMVHIFCEDLLLGKRINTDDGYVDENGKHMSVPDEAKKRLLAFMDFYNEKKPNVLATELMFYNNDKKSDGNLVYKWAGTSDIIYKSHNNKIILCDIKTGRENQGAEKSYSLQLTSYKILWDAMYGDKYGKIDHLVVLYLTDRGTYKLKEVKYAPRIWSNVIEIFYHIIKDGRGNYPKIEKKKDLPNIFEIKKDV